MNARIEIAGNEVIKPGLVKVKTLDGQDFFSTFEMSEGTVYDVTYEVTAKGNNKILTAEIADLSVKEELDAHFDEWVRACIASDRISIQNIGKDDETWRREVLKHAKWFSENVGK
jgi:hypothetical protein